MQPLAIDWLTGTGQSLFIIFVVAGVIVFFAALTAVASVTRWAAKRKNRL